MKSKPKILLLDIETFPNVGTFWDCKIYGYLSPDNIVQERSIICASCKWVGVPGVRTYSISAQDPANDMLVVEAVYEELNEADAVVAHNGDAFDLPWVRARGIYHGFQPFAPLVQIDTKKEAKKNFKFNSNRLVYLAEYLKVGKKIKTEFELWKECAAGSEKALKKMIRYNKRDVVLLEKVYKKLRPYLPARLNYQLFTHRDSCPACGSEHVNRHGYSFTQQRKYARYKCQAPGCGHPWRSRVSEKV